MCYPRLSCPALLGEVPDELNVETWIERQGKGLNFPFENPTYVVCTTGFNLLGVNCRAVPCLDWLTD